MVGDVIVGAAFVGAKIVGTANAGAAIAGAAIGGAVIVVTAVAGKAIVDAATVVTAGSCAGGEVAMRADDAVLTGAVTGTVLPSVVASGMIHKPIAAMTTVNTPAPMIGTRERVWR